MKKGINIIIYSVLALAVIFGNISIIKFIINDKEIMSMAEATKEPVIMPTETPEISYHVLVNELPVFKYNTISENKTKDAIMGKYFYGDKIKTKSQKDGQIYTQTEDGCYVWSSCIGSLPEDNSLNSQRPEVIVIDAGNQENQETGAKQAALAETATNSSIQETSLNFKIAQKIKEKLEENGYIAIINTDININGEYMSGLANQIKADAMVSICFGSAARKKRNGATVYCSTRDNQNIKKKKYLRNKLLAKNIFEAYTKETGFNGRGVKESDNYPSINCCKIPMAIIEMGYITNKKDYNKMNNSGFQDKMAEGIVNGIKGYFTSL